MDEERLPADFRRLLTLAEKIHDKRYRDNYVAAHTRHLLARQMRNFRGDLSQGEFGELIGKRQTVVSRLENPNYGAWTLRTMFDVARKLNVAVFVRFVDYPTFLKYSDDLSERATRPSPYDETVEEIERLAEKGEQVAKDGALKAFFSRSSEQPEPGPSVHPQDTGISLPEMSFRKADRRVPPAAANDQISATKQTGAITAIR